MKWKRKKQCEFKSLDIGEVFILGSDFYIKVEDIQIKFTQNNDITLLNCVNLLSGELVYCEEDANVYTPPYSFKILVREVIK